MLTDTKLRNLRPKDKLYKVNDRDGLYVAVTPAGSISFRYNYAIHGRQETITFGRYGVGGITLAEARERLGEAKKLIAAGKSPAKEKARDKARIKDAETFGAWAEKWLEWRKTRNEEARPPKRDESRGHHACQSCWGRSDEASEFSATGQPAYEAEGLRRSARHDHHRAFDRACQAVDW